MRNALLLFTSICFTSCASLFNTKRCCVHIKAQGGTKVIWEDSAAVVPLKGDITLELPRSEEPYKLILQNDTLIKEHYLMPTVSRTVFFNVLNLGIGLPIDWKKDKWYRYHRHHWIDITDTANRYYRHRPGYKGRISFNISLPVLNLFYFRESPQKDFARKGGLGVTLGANYWCGATTFYSVQTGIAVGTPFGERFGDTIDTWHMINSFINVKRNHTIANFNLGYGISLSYHNMEDGTRISTDSGSYFYKIREIHRSFGIGISLSAHYKFSNLFSAGVLYQPRLLDFTKELHWRYSHGIFLEGQLSINKKMRYNYNK